MDNFYRNPYVISPKTSIWSDESNASEILNNEFFGSNDTASIQVPTSSVIVTGFAPSIIISFTIAVASLVANGNSPSLQKRITVDNTAVNINALSSILKSIVSPSKSNVIVGQSNPILQNRITVPKSLIVAIAGSSNLIKSILVERADLFINANPSILELVQSSIVINIGKANIDVIGKSLEYYIFKREFVDIQLNSFVQSQINRESRKSDILLPSKTMVDLIKESKVESEINEKSTVWRYM